MDETTTKRCYMAEELRVVEPDSEGGQATIVGLAVPYGALSEDLGGFSERILPGAFSDSLASGDIVADVEHDPNRKLGRTSKGTLSLKDSRRGLVATIKVPNTTVGRDTVEEVRNGNLDGMSIVFRKPVDKFRGAAGKIVRDISKATLRAVTLTSLPAYRQTAGSLAMRSLYEYRCDLEGVIPVQTAPDATEDIKREGVKPPCGVFIADGNTEDIKRLQDRAELDPASY